MITFMVREAEHDTTTMTGIERLWGIWERSGFWLWPLGAAAAPARGRARGAGGAAQIKAQHILIARFLEGSHPSQTVFSGYPCASSLEIR